MNGTDDPAIYTIPANRSFVDTLATGIKERVGDDPASLARVRVLLPTRRACRSLREAFLRISNGEPTLLPHMTPLGDVDEDELVIGGDWGSDDPLGGGSTFDIPPAMSGTRRQLLLARMIMARGETLPDQAVRLASELARLLDQIHTERRPFSDLKSLVDGEFAEHWQQTLEFLTILTDLWPNVLKDEGVIDNADRRNRLLEAQTRHWQNSPPDAPVIAAGSTGSIPATADLLGCISRLRNGAVVLPGLDQASDETVWSALEAHHPQYGLARLLEHLEIGRQDVREWVADESELSTSARIELINSALVPARATTRTAPAEIIDAGALENLHRVDCPNPREESGIIAMAIRQALEHPAKTVALVTPDRALARRVTSELKRWDIDIDDSAGLPLALSPTGAFLRLSAEMVSERFAPVPLLATLKHPMAAGGMERATFRRAVRQLELSILRGPRPDAGTIGLKHAHDAAKKIDPDCTALIDHLAHTSATFASLLQKPVIDVRDLLEAHVEMVEHLATTDTEPGAQRLWSGEDGEAMAAFVAELADAVSALGEIPPWVYPAVLDNLMAGRAVRPRFGRHPRVHIWGLMEARLQRADLMILGGLNEGSWPPDARPSPWMSRPMISKFGLALPERRIGLTAHDFVQGFNAPEVLLTRSERVDGTPTVPSRWLLRLDNRLEALGHKEGIDGSGDLAHWFDLLDQPDDTTPRTVSAPAPTPPVEARPRQLSVTRIETWIRDPYAIFAERILRLRSLDPLDADPGAADRGTLIHKALESFIDAMPPGDLPDDALEQLTHIGRDVFDNVLVRPGIRAFWWPRFLRIAEWFVTYERDRRLKGIITLGNEAKGEMEVPSLGGTFKLTATADRIDRLIDGSLAVLDYKTGQPPSKNQVESGLVPQLSLEAVMAGAGAFENLDAALVEDLIYIRLSGGRVPGEEKRLKLEVSEVADNALSGLKRLITAFDNPATPYRSRPRPMFKSRFGDYDHLARVREWASAEGEDG